MSKTSSLLLAGLAACSDYDINGIPEDTYAKDTSTLSEDTGDTADTSDLPDSGSESVPPTSFKSAIQACLTLDTSMCQWNQEERGVDADCVAKAEARKANLEAKILEKAQEVSGDSTLTMTDVENGNVPATVYASYALHQANLSSKPAWSNYAYINIAFGHVAEKFELMEFPFDPIDEDTLRCMASAYSREVDLEANEVTWQNMETKNYWLLADGSNLADTRLNVLDFRVFGTGENVIEINENQYDTEDENFDFTSTEDALADSNEQILTAAQTQTGIVGEGNTSVIVEY